MPKNWPAACLDPGILRPIFHRTVERSFDSDSRTEAPGPAAHSHEKFVGEATVEVERVRQRDDLERYSKANLIHYSRLPWFDFTSLSHARDFGKDDSTPRITFGKITETKGPQHYANIDSCAPRVG
jgi:hypothetical protein